VVNYIHPDSRIGVLTQDRIAILTPGEDLNSGYVSWPTLRFLTLSDHPLMVPVTVSGPEPYHMPLEQGCTLGGNQSARVEQVSLSRNRICFEFENSGGLFPGIPRMQVSFRDEVCTVLFPTCVLSSAFTDLPCGDSPITLLSAQDTPEGALLTLSCPSLPEGAGLTRWYVQEHTQPVTDLPGVSIHLVRDWGGGYPQDW